MFERFTERASRVVTLAQLEARGLGHNYIGTEHLLLGLLGDEEAMAARVLGSLGVTAQAVRDEVVRVVGRTDQVVDGQIPFTPRATKVLELALREALALGHNYIGTEHILLGLVTEGEGVGAGVLASLGAADEKIKAEMIRRLAGADFPSRPGSRVGSFEPFSAFDPGNKQQVRIACPNCGAILETISMGTDTSRSAVVADADYNCPACAKRWAFSYRLRWSERPSPTGDA
jgi:ATP-dependent Clp protease ATP-binding subunit ClpA